MFGDMMGGLEEKQAGMKKKLAEIILDIQSNEGEIKIKISGTSEILNIEIAESLMQSAEKEKLEDLLLVTINEAIQASAAQGEEMARQMMQEMLPPGFEGMKGLFG